jgi:hypothetical protein
VGEIHNADSRAIGNQLEILEAIICLAEGVSANRDYKLWLSIWFVFSRNSEIDIRVFCTE